MGPPEAPLRRSPTTRALFIAAVLALVALSFLRRDELQCDDAFITFRYAENLATGRGLVFNSGERVEGYSNLLHTLLLAAGRALGASPILGANLLGALAGTALLLLLPPFAAALGASPTRGAAAAIALGLTASFQGWTSRGLETVPFAALVAGGLLLVVRGLEGMPRASAGGAALLGLAAVSRPEGIAYAALAGIAIALCSGAGAASRALPLLAGPHVGQLMFRLLYYREWFPNPYHVKLTGRPGRWQRGLGYVGDFAQSAPLLALLMLAALGAALLSRRPARRLVALAAATGIAFAASTGGESYPDFRFLVPALPLALLLAAVLLPGRPGDLVALALLPAVLASAAGATIPRTLSRVIAPALRGDTTTRAFLARRAAELVGPVDEPMTRMALRLREEVGPEGLLAIADAGRIPFASGLHIVDLAGLMDRRLARLPGTARADIGYVLGRDPDVVALHLADFWFGSPMDHLLVASPRLLQRYELRHAIPLPRRHAYLFFVRTTAEEGERFVDLTGWAGPAEKSATSAAGAIPAEGLVVPLFRDALLPPGERSRISAVVADAPGTTEGIARVDAEVRAAAEVTRHGIRFELPPGVREVALCMTVRSPGPAARLLADPVLLSPGAPGALALEASCAGRAASAAPGTRLELALPDEPTLVLLLRVHRDDAAEPALLLAVSPEIVAAPGAAGGPSRPASLGLRALPRRREPEGRELPAGGRELVASPLREPQASPVAKLRLEPAG